MAFKKAEVLRTQYMDIIDPLKLVAFVTDKVGVISVATLFKPPAVPDVPFADLTAAATDVTTSKTTYDNAPTTPNLGLLQGKMDFLKGKLNLEADWIERISNDPANATSTATAANNIDSSGFAHHKIGRNTKGSPIQPAVDVEHIASGEIKAKIKNVEYTASQTTFIVVETAANAVVSIVDGQVMIQFPALVLPQPPASQNPGSLLTVNSTGTPPPPVFQNVIIVPVQGKGKSVAVKHLTSGKGYTVYAFGKNAKGNVSPLSNPQSFFST